MSEHVAVLDSTGGAGTRACFWPSWRPGGPYGIGIVLAENQAEAEALRDRDPAIESPHGFTTEIAPMLRLVTPDRTYDAVTS